ncbi:MAG: tRNA uridine-5-carboxymethylaminomethyl(34) synthesis enzyme MnmG [Syntrophales bacterium]|jgi:tRNA uridine 5-carboxymethylaminomethyl modification enzyme|nr:tRNA uridine-5-carboxymethylaminomethyl(34) synthesis enzyme MnmG [Syntrophales bacterium]MCK9527118.1 tRNA uridine-5-carboxymethylaminomethyl(34) synthesis enzyme MnmG [Syntrophales bacterium]MDX9921757.1 tRNA uridine-5-carboxymethylaminomethyl(34) synthesis enzyme MnmG [Syntrophales bacterium]
MAGKTGFDIIVVGAGHAGCEAALAAARMGCDTLLFNINLDSMALMSCNPAIGGLGKGQIVKEVDALGGEMGKIADLTACHFRRLNVSKGPAVQSTRCQCDKQLYRLAMKQVLERQPGLALRQGLVETLVVRDGRVRGVLDNTGFFSEAKAVIITVGTFLNGLVHIGMSRQPAGRAGEIASIRLAQNLRELGFVMGRMKTGTPPRLRASSIDFSVMERQDSDPDPRPFSFSTTRLREERLPSYFTATSNETRRIIIDNIGHSPLYSGAIMGSPARYCPSLEDKFMRFADKTSHPVVLEHEGLETEEIYAKGLGNSLPLELQDELVRSVPGLEEAEIMRSAYAIEYDYIQSTQLAPTLETKLVRGLYLAGQPNGTSGYEEAAGQGILAGINAALAVQKREPFILDRSEAYLGVMVDDLVTQGVDEPYRMFTSRAEYRLMLREDNAAARLMKRGFELGLITREQYLEMEETERRIREGIGTLTSRKLYPLPETNRLLESLGTEPLKQAVTFFQILKRPGITCDGLAGLEGWEGMGIEGDDVKRRIETEAKYEGYIQRQKEDVKRFRDLEGKKLPPDIDYSMIPSLSRELVKKLSAVRPSSLGQAKRIPGMTQGGLSALLIFSRKINAAREPDNRNQQETAS